MELAVHDWLVEWGSYDRTVYDNPNHSGRTGYRDPWGMLVGATATVWATPAPSSF